VVEKILREKARSSTWRNLLFQGTASLLDWGSWREKARAKVGRGRETHNGLLERGRRNFQDFFSFSLKRKAMQGGGDKTGRNLPG